jgi:hypothetical protein
MAINPFRIGELQLPTPVKPVAYDLSPLGKGLSDLGAGIGAYRRQQEIGSLLADSTDEAGNLDPIKAATRLGSAGYSKEAQDLLDSAIKKQVAQSTLDYHTQSLKQSGEYQQGLLKARQDEIARQTERNKQQQENELAVRDLARKKYEEGDLITGKDFLGQPKYFRRPGGTDTLVPLPTPEAVPPAATPGPRSELMPGGPETAPPFQVAALGGMAPVPGASAMPPPAAPAAQIAQAAPAPAPAEKVPAGFPPEGMPMLRAIGEYQTALPAENRPGWVKFVKEVYPGYDPSEFDRRQKELNRPAPQFTPNQIKDLQTEGGKGQQAIGFLDTFQPEFAGPKFTGGLLMEAGNRLPESVSSKIDSDLPKAAAWWRGYENFKNDVRNQQFGATLTRGEAAAFDRANITPGLDPKQAQLLLERQKAIVTGALKRTASGLITEGYNPKTIAAAYGMDLKDLGVTAEAPEKRGAARVSTKDQANSRIDQARAAYQRDPSQRDEIIRRLQDMGVPNAATVLGQ